MQNGNYTVEQLKDKVLKAMGSKQEGTNYDFKSNWTAFVDADKLDKHLLALLNVLNDEDCFIVVGVNEKRDQQTKKVLEYFIKDGVNLKDQKEQNFYNNRVKNLYPNPSSRLHLNNIEIDGKVVQVLSIENRLEKPYFKVTNDGKMDGSIYIRHNESSEAAFPQEIEELYKYRLRVNEGFLEKFVRFLQDLEGWVSHLSSNGGSCYYLKAPEFNIRLRHITTKSGGSEKLVEVADLFYAGTLISPDFFLQYSIRKDGVPQCLIPEFLTRNHDIRNGLFYNICLIASSCVGDFKKLQIEKRKEVFEESCLISNIFWRD